MTTEAPKGPAVTSTPDPADVEKNKIFAILAYFGILFLVPLLAAKDSPFARYHTNQGVCLFIAAVCVWIPLVIISMIPLINLTLFVLMPATAFGIFAFMIIGILNAAQGRMTPLPIIGAYSIVK